MAYEVVKTINGRGYRYRVQSERDADSGRTRNRWTYLGRVAGETGVRVRAPRQNARIRLLAAAERLLEAGEVSAITADAIAVAAGVAHGTFYRYFRDRSAALEALARHLRETGAFGDDRLLRDDVASSDEARRQLRTWVQEKLQSAGQRRASIRAWHSLVAGDKRLAEFRKEKRDATVSRLREHLTVLAARGFAVIADPAATADMLAALVEGVVRATLLESDSLDQARIAAAADLAERGVFADL